MNIKKIEQSLQRNIVLMLALGLVVSLILGGLVYRNDINTRLDSVLIEQQRKIAQAQLFWGQKIGDISHTIRLLHRTPALNYALSEKNEVRTDLLARLFSAFAESVETLMQVRWLDAEGVEVVRLDFVDGVPVVADSETLQDKSDRYYVKQGMSAQDGQIFLSDIDLNVENGKIEVPYRPTIRATIRTGPLSGLHSGLLILNYDVGQLLKIIEGFDSDVVQLLMLDKHGYWIKHSDPNLEWGRDLNQKSNNASIQNLKLWGHMAKSDSQRFYSSSLGLVSYQCHSLTSDSLFTDIIHSPSLCYVATTSDAVMSKLKGIALLPAVALSAIVLLFGLFILRREWELRMKLITLYRAQELDKKVIEESAEHTRNLLKQQQLLQSDLVESRKLSALGMMVAGVAHELNTPIGSAIMATSKLNKDTQQLAQAVQTGLTKSALHHYLEDSQTGLTLISQSQKKAADLIRSFKRLAIDRAREEVVTYDLKQVVNDLVVTLVPKFKTSSVEHHIEVDPIEMVGRPGIISQVIQNLLVNSLQHAFKERSSGKLTLTAKLINSGNLVEIKIRDNGVGIAPEVLPNIFDPFVTTNRAKGNTGLGMHFVHQWVTETLDGTINVESELNKGTCFTIKVPQRSMVKDDLPTA